MKAILVAIFVSFFPFLGFSQDDGAFPVEASPEIVEDSSSSSSSSSGSSGEQEYILSPTIPDGKDIVENAVATAKERFLLVNSEKVNLSEPADFDRIQALVFIRNRPVLDISELEALGGARIIHLGKFAASGVSEEETKISWKGQE